MSKYVYSLFTNGGIPAVGLSPIVRIVDLSNGALEIDNDSMTEIGYGFYKYEFLTYDVKKEYGVIVDGGSTLLNSSERYQSGFNNFVSLEEMSNELDESSANIR